MNENEKKKLRLFVVGESSGDPADWSEWPHRALVIAENVEEALTIMGDLAIPGVAHEVLMDKPVVLHVDTSGLVDNL